MVAFVLWNIDWHILSKWRLVDSTNTSAKYMCALVCTLFIRKGVREKANFVL